MYKWATLSKILSSAILIDGNEENKWWCFRDKRERDEIK